MIKIKNISKNYPNTKIFKNLNLEINSWNIISIVWPSWSWKSTLLNLISGLDINFSWDIIIDWKSIKKIKSDEKVTKFRWKNISFIFQDFNLIENLTVEENIDLVIDINKIERNYSTKKILKLVWLENKNEEYPFNLSWWEKQRVAIARAFVWKNKLLLADEPTWSLDLENTKNISSLIKKLNKKTKNTIVLITHDREVAKIGDKIFELKDYNLIEKNA
mgnify:CR=1 FL=1